MQTIGSRNAAFQQWRALLSNRSKRRRAGEFLVHGVRPITLALSHGWPVTSLIYDASRPLSRWARDTLAAAPARQVAMAPELLRDLSGKEQDVPELIAVVATPPDDLDRIPVTGSFLGIAFDRPSSPGNVGMLVRSADAFGADGVIVTGHAADLYDPKSVRAATGSLFALPAIRQPGHLPVTQWARERGITVIGTDENGTDDLDRIDLTGPVLLAIGNETTGLSGGWRAACDLMAKIPITGAASSLNAAAAATVALYEAARQRAASSRGSPPPGGPGSSSGEHGAAAGRGQGGHPPQRETRP